jgi:hypothetical protein
MRWRNVANVATETAVVAEVMAAVRRSAVGVAAKAVHFKVGVSVRLRAPCPAALSVLLAAVPPVGSRSVHSSADLAAANHFAVVNPCRTVFVVRHVRWMPGGKPLNRLS